MKIVSSLALIVFCYIALKWVLLIIGPEVENRSPAYVEYGSAVLYIIAGISCLLIIFNKSWGLGVLVLLLIPSIALNYIQGKFYWVMNASEFNDMPIFLLIPWTFAFEIVVLILLLIKYFGMALSK
ncbi:MAG: hypothetical protein GY797_37845 [Deltaproteobacteria bacterium]|nr:hypothetical protein [Deltaproteobacteria bacterium]